MNGPKRLFLFITIIILFSGISSLLFQEKKEGEVMEMTPDKPVFTEAISAEETDTLDEKIGKVLADQRLKGSQTGISIRRKDTGEEIYQYFGELRLHPASNMKVLTAIGALEVLGQDHQFETLILTDGEIQGKVLKGNLYIKGKGDPTLQREDLEQFALELKEKGIGAIDGNIVGDDEWYDDVRLSQDLNWSDEPFFTGAQVSALTVSPDNDYDAGTVIVEVSPGDGEKATVNVIPANDYVTIENRTTMVASGGARDITVERKHGENTIIVEGTVPKDSPVYRSWASVWEPTGLAVHLFAKELEKQGIELSANTKLTRGKTPENAQLLTKKTSIPLSELLVPFMKLSNNGHGEVLIKEMGKKIQNEGSWDAGLAVLEETVAKFGADTSTLLLRDGSGMSHKNLIPASELTKLLYEIQEQSWFSVFLKSLPVAGEPERMVGGTLRNRLTSEPLRGKVVAKTGSLTGVFTLAGYITALDGSEWIFAILNNNYIVDDGEIAEIQDKIAEIIITHFRNE